MRSQTVLACVVVMVLFGAAKARAQISDDVVKIGVLNDQSGLYADLGGPGSVTAARMAAEDAGGTVLGKPIEIVFADHQNKADIGVAVARRWFESEKSTWRPVSTIPRSRLPSSSSRPITERV